MPFAVPAGPDDRALGRPVHHGPDSSLSSPALDSRTRSERPVPRRSNMITARTRRVLDVADEQWLLQVESRSPLSAEEDDVHRPSPTSW